MKVVDCRQDVDEGSHSVWAVVDRVLLASAADQWNPDIYCQLEKMFLGESLPESFYGMGDLCRRVDEILVGVEWKPSDTQVRKVRTDAQKAIYIESCREVDGFRPEGWATGRFSWAKDVDVSRKVAKDFILGRLGWETVPEKSDPIWKERKKFIESSHWGVLFKTWGILSILKKDELPLVVFYVFGDEYDLEAPKRLVNERDEKKGVVDVVSDEVFSSDVGVEDDFVETKKVFLQLSDHFGWGDPLIPSVGSRLFFERRMEVLEGDISKFLSSLECKNVFQFFGIGDDFCEGVLDIVPYPVSVKVGIYDEDEAKKYLQMSEDIYFISAVRLYLSKQLGIDDLLDPRLNEATATLPSAVSSSYDLRFSRIYGEEIKYNRYMVEQEFPGISVTDKMDMYQELDLLLMKKIFNCQLSKMNQCAPVASSFRNFKNQSINRKIRGLAPLHKDVLRREADKLDVYILGEALKRLGRSPTESADEVLLETMNSIDTREDPWRKRRLNNVLNLLRATKKVYLDDSVGTGPTELHAFVTKESEDLGFEFDWNLVREHLSEQQWRTVQLVFVDDETQVQAGIILAQEDKRNEPYSHQAIASRLATIEKKLRKVLAPYYADQF